ncbi:glycosyltransferase family 2 protein [Shewanella putrefaciens]|uniref:glycosyltransferase family 2 protein n=1 Tax=Shewanella putrefaciens TaxID=24 RepID=UPI0018E713B0|nr:glycosyltransferase [Shewanella putrefaciens]
MSEKYKKNIITVAVITYHSAATVLETLDSIVTQTYGPENIELIISDDGSRDMTVEVIELWLVQNQNKFYRVKFFANEKNCGVSKNCNVAWKTATSEWIKTIAGDDILLPNCIDDNIKYINSHTDDTPAIIFSYMKLFTNNNSNNLVLLGEMPAKDELVFFDYNTSKQIKYLQSTNISGAPSAFINRSILDKVGYADERFPLIEDYPLWFSTVKAGHRIGFVAKQTVLYRIGESSSRTKLRLVNEKYIKQLLLIDEKLIFPTLNSTQIFLKFRKRLWIKLVLLLSLISGNKNSPTSRFFLILIYFIKPKYMYQKFARFFNRVVKS